MGATNEIFKNRGEKRYFIKIDTDTFPIPENLLSYVNKVDFSTRNKPVLFGKGVCSPQNMCYGAGALYGINKLALHEDYMVSYAYRQATGYPIISNHNIFNYHIAREGTGSENHPPICYHKAKTVEGLYEYYELLYDP